MGATLNEFRAKIQIPIIKTAVETGKFRIDNFLNDSFLWLFLETFCDNLVIYHHNELW